MGLFSNLFGSNNSAAQLAQTQAELDAANAKIEELESREPDVEVREVQVEVPVEVVAETVTVVSVFVDSFTKNYTKENFYHNFGGMQVRDFLRQVNPAANLEALSSLTLATSGGQTVSLDLDSYIPKNAEAAAELGLSGEVTSATSTQSSGSGGAIA